jgi:hypothetical protein
MSHTLLLMALSAFLMPVLGDAGAPPAAIGDQVELKATHQAGVPFHQVPGGGQTFQRVPGGTVATVMDLARSGS